MLLPPGDCRDSSPPIPGFVDLQVNGYAGVDFSNPKLLRADFVSAARRVLDDGCCVAFLPTIITSPLETYETVLPMLADVIEEINAARGGGGGGGGGGNGVGELPAGSLLGVHLEGPFISGESGAVGCHPPEHTRAPSTELLERWQSLARGQIRVITVAAELDGCEALVRRALSLGIVVSLGHQLAEAGDIARLADAGASLCTHLGNGMPNMIHRHRNTLWASLADDRLQTCLITDGEHLPRDAIVSFVRAKGSRGIIVTSDVAPVAGLDPGLHLWGHTRVRVEAPSDAGAPTRVRAAELPCLAGSGSLMVHCVNHLAGLAGSRRPERAGELLLSEAELEEVSFYNPLRAIGVDEAQIAALLRGAPRRVKFDAAQGCYVVYE